MALHIKRTSLFKTRIMSTMLMIFVLMVQPLVVLNIPAAFAATQVVINNESATLNAANSSYQKTVDTSGLSDIVLSFNYDGSTLDDNNGTVTLNYSAGSTSGSVEINGADGLSNIDESGDVTLAGVPAQVSLPVSIAIADVSEFKGDDSVVLSNIHLAGNAAPVVTPEITSVDAYYTVGSGYTAISVDFKTENITDANGVELRVNRSDETTYSVTAKDKVVTAINTTSPKTTSGPIVITGSRTSSSWNDQTGTWTGSSTPVSVDVIITRDGGDDLILGDDTISETKATQAEVFANVPEITSVQAEYVTRSDPGETYTGVYVGFGEKGIADSTNPAKKIELRLNRDDSTTYSTFAQQPVIDAVNAGTAPYGTGGTVIITGSRTSGSWDPQTGTWVGVSRLAATNPVEVVITLEDDTVLSKSIALEADVTGQGSKSAVFAKVPSLSFDASYIAAPSYTGINVDIRTPNLVDATGVEITVDRTNGDPDVWVSNPDSAVSTSVVDALNGTNHKTTAPIVIVEGSRTRTSSTSWLTSSVPWTNNQEPQSVTVRVKRSGGPDLVQTVSIIKSAGGMTWAQIAAQLPEPAASDTIKPIISINPEVPQIVSGTASFAITVTDDQPLDEDKNKQTWVEVYGRYDQTKKKGQKVNLSSGNGTFTFDSKTLPDGEYILRVGSVEDAAGNKSGDKSFKYVTVDNTAPTFSLTDDGSPRKPITDGAVVNPEKIGGKEIRFAKESSTDVLYVNGAKINASGYVGHNSGKIGWKFTSEDTYELFTRDEAGNQSESITITIDKTAPTTSITLNSTINPTVAQIVADDKNLNRIDVSLWTDNNTTQVAIKGEWYDQPSFSKDYASLLNFSSLPDGEYTIRATANDKAWNATNAANVNFTVDRTAPKISNVQFSKIVNVNDVDHTSANLNGGILEVTFTTDEPLKLVGSQVGMSIPGLSGVPATGWTKVELVNASENKYKASISLVDRTDTSSANYVDDFFAGKRFESVKLYFRTVDTLNNTDSVYYYPDGSFGKSPSEAYTFTIDNIAPEVKSATLNGEPANIAPRDKNVGPTDFNLIGGKFTLGLTVEDATDTTRVRYRVVKVNASGGTESGTYRSNWFNMTNTDGNDWTSAEFDTALVGSVHPNSLGDLITNGTYTIQIETRDSLGNIATNQYVDIAIDNTAPEVKILGATLVSENEIEFTGTVFDENLSHYYCWLTPVTGGEVGSRGENCITTWASGLQRNGNPATSLITGTDGEELLGQIDITGLADGDYIIRMGAKDRAGNLNTQEVYTITVDRSVFKKDVTDDKVAFVNPQAQGISAFANLLGSSEEEGNQIFQRGNFATGLPTGNEPGEQEEGGTEGNDPTILGEQDESGSLLDDTAILGAQDEGGVLGLSWQWWLAIVAGLIGGWLLIAAGIRRMRGAES